MVGYHLISEDHSIQLGSGGSCESPPQQVQCNVLIIAIIVILIIIFSEFLIKSQSNLSLNFLIKWFLIKKQRVYQTYEILECSWQINCKKNQPSKWNLKVIIEVMKKILSLGKYIWSIDIKQNSCNFCVAHAFIIMYFI